MIFPKLDECLYRQNRYNCLHHKQEIFIVCLNFHWTTSATWHLRCWGHGRSRRFAQLQCDNSMRGFVFCLVRRSQRFVVLLGHKSWCSNGYSDIAFAWLLRRGHKSTDSFCYEAISGRSFRATILALPCWFCGDLPLFSSVLMVILLHILWWFFNCGAGGLVCSGAAMSLWIFR